MFRNLVVRETVSHPRAGNSTLSQRGSDVLDAHLADGSQLALDDKGTPEHHQETAECEKKVDRQRHHGENEPRNNPKDCPAHRLGRLSIHARRRSKLRKTLIFLQLLFDLAKDSLLVV
jgi:hypothetical protein